MQPLPKEIPMNDTPEPCDTPDTPNGRAIEFATTFPVQQWGELWRNAMPEGIEQPDRCSILVVGNDRFQRALAILGIPDRVAANIPFIAIHQFGGAHALLFSEDNPPRNVEFPKEVTVITKMTTISIASLPGGCEVADCCGGLICAHDR
jgi:hypothetical protein